MVENGYDKDDEEDTSRKNIRKRPCFAFNKSYMNQFSTKLRATSTTNKAWATLMLAYHGSFTVVRIKLLTFNRELQNLHIKYGETLQKF